MSADVKHANLPSPPASKRHCWNCWSSTHERATCPKPLLNLYEREALRIKLNAPRPIQSEYQSLLDCLCFNCWETTEHNHMNCPRRRLTHVAREKLRRDKGVEMTELWRDFLITNGFRVGDFPPLKNGNGNGKYNATTSSNGKKIPPTVPPKFAPDDPNLVNDIYEPLNDHKSNTSNKTRYRHWADFSDGDYEEELSTTPLFSPPPPRKTPIRVKVEVEGMPGNTTVVIPAGAGTNNAAGISQPRLLRKPDEVFSGSGTRPASLGIRAGPGTADPKQQGKNTLADMSTKKPAFPTPSASAVNSKPGSAGNWSKAPGSKPLVVTSTPTGTQSAAVPPGIGQNGNSAVNSKQSAIFSPPAKNPSKATGSKPLVVTSTPTVTQSSKPPVNGQKDAFLPKSTVFHFTAGAKPAGNPMAKSPASESAFPNNINFTPSPKQAALSPPSHTLPPNDTPSPPSNNSHQQSTNTPSNRPNQPLTYPPNITIPGPPQSGTALLCSSMQTINESLLLINQSIINISQNLQGLSALSQDVLLVMARCQSLELQQRAMAAEADSRLRALELDRRERDRERERNAGMPRFEFRGNWNSGIGQRNGNDVMQNGGAGSSLFANGNGGSGSNGSDSPKSKGGNGGSGSAGVW